MTSSQLLGALTLLVAGGCSVVRTGDPVQVHEYDLLPAAPPGRPIPAADAPGLQLARFGVDPVIDRDGLVWRRGQVEVGSYSLHRWARPPEEALRDLLASALGAALPEVGVATEPPLDAPTYVLAGHLTRCEELERGERWYGVIALQVALRTVEGDLLLRGSYQVEELAAARNAPGVVKALERAAARLADQVAADARAAIETHAATK